MIIESVAEPESAAFERAIEDAVLLFTGNRLLTMLDAERLRREHYTELLCQLYYQVDASSTSFSLAAAHTPGLQSDLRRYLMKHAEEEMRHADWIADDLQALGFNPNRLRADRPRWPTAAYIAYNCYIAMTEPLSRLGIAMVLETLGATIGSQYAAKLVRLLALEPKHMTFLSGHAASDVVHIRELKTVIAENSSAVQRATLVHAAHTGAALYRQIYDEIADSNP